MSYQSSEDTGCLIIKPVQVTFFQNVLSELGLHGSCLGWFTANLANVFLTNLQGPILRKKSRDHINPKLLSLTMHLKVRYTSYHHRQSLTKNFQQISFYLKISIFFQFSPISVMLNMSFRNGHKLWIETFHKIPFEPTQCDPKLCSI